MINCRSQRDVLRKEIIAHSQADPSKRDASEKERALNTISTFVEVLSKERARLEVLHRIRCEQIDVEEEMRHLDLEQRCVVKCPSTAQGGVFLTV